MPENKNAVQSAVGIAFRDKDGVFTNIGFIGEDGITLHAPDPTEIKGVWFNPPHTTVRWGDGKTTTVRCGENDTYDPMIGFLLCVAKRHFGNTGRYLEVMRANGVPECPKPTTIEVCVGKADYVCVSTEAWNEVR